MQKHIRIAYNIFPVFFFFYSPNSLDTQKRRKAKKKDMTANEMQELRTKLPSSLVWLRELLLLFPFWLSKRVLEGLVMTTWV